MNAFKFYSDQDKEEVKKILNVDEASIKRDTDILKQWLEKQSHLPQGIQDDFFFENMLIRNKCRVEKAKECIDSYYTCRTVWPDMFENIEKVVPSKHNVRFIPLAPLGSQKERYIWCDIVSPDASIYKFQDFPDITIGVCELLLKYDYNNGFRIIIDLNNCSTETIAKWSPAILAKTEKICTRAYASRIIAVDLYRPGSLISILLRMVKSVLPQKIYDRIVIHNDLESLTKVVPQEILPKEYGGKERSFAEFLAEQDELFDKNRRLLEDMTNVKSNEKMRMGKCSYDIDIYGTEGTFKKLNLD